MTFIVRLDERGRVVLPIKMREKMNLKKGSLLELSLNSSEIRIRNIREENLSVVQISKNSFELV